MKTEYMHLQYYASNDGDGILAGESLIFNRLLSSTDGLYYNLKNGTVCLEKPGTYQIDWAVMFNSVDVPGELYLETNTGLAFPGVAIENYSSLSRGSVFLEVTEPTTIRLVNRTMSSMSVTIIKSSVTANLVVRLIESAEKRNPIVVPFTAKEDSYPNPYINYFGDLLQLSIVGSDSSTTLPVTITNTGKTRYSNQYYGSSSEDYLIFPYEVVLVAAVSYFTTRNQVEMHTPETNISPYIAIALPYDESNTDFEVVEESKVYSENGFRFRSEVYMEGTSFKAIKTGLNITIPAKTPIQRVCGLESLGDQSADMNASLNVNGTLVFEIIN